MPFLGYIAVMEKEYFKELASRLRKAKDTNMGKYGQWAYFKFEEIESIAKELEQKSL